MMNGQGRSQSKIIGFITDINTPQFHLLSGWLDSGDPAGEEAGCGGPVLPWLHVVCGCEAG
jgi:hypothetical protein